MHQLPLPLCRRDREDLRGVHGHHLHDSAARDVFSGNHRGDPAVCAGVLGKRDQLQPVLLGSSEVSYGGRLGGVFQFERWWEEG